MFTSYASDDCGSLDLILLIVHADISIGIAELALVKSAMGKHNLVKVDDCCTALDCSVDLAMYLFDLLFNALLLLPRQKFSLLDYLVANAFTAVDLVKLRCRDAHIAEHFVEDACSIVQCFTYLLLQCFLCSQILKVFFA